jgi:HAD superfamily hydrolase (TIGR01509 family)
VDALVFDFDGLILDTELPIFTSWHELFVAHGVEPLSVQEWAASIGTQAGLDAMAILHERAGYVDDVLVEARVARRNELLALEVLRPGVREWIAEASAAGLRVGIASSSEPEWVLEHLERFGLTSSFGAIACWEEGRSAKPAPDIYLAACDGLGVAPEDALAIEDSPNGIAAARAAGLRCVAVPNALTESYDLSAADVVLRSLADATLTEVLSTL